MGRADQAMLHLLVLLLTAPAALLADCDGIVEIESSDADHWQAKLLLVSDTDIEAWAVKITFDMEVDFIESAMAEIPGPLNGWTLALGFSSNVDLLESAAATASGSGLSWELANKDWDAEIPEGQNLSLHFIVDYSGERPDLTKLDLEGVSLCREQCIMDCSSSIELSDVTSTSFQAMMNLIGPLSGWQVALDFSSPITSIESPMAEVTGAGESWTLNNLGFDGNVEEGSSLELRFKVLHSGTQQPDMVDIRVNGVSLCSMGVDDCVPPTSPPTRPPSPTNSPTTSQEPDACACDKHTIKDPNCLNCANDPYGCLGCKACGVEDCRSSPFSRFFSGFAGLANTLKSLVEVSIDKMYS